MPCVLCVKTFSIRRMITEFNSFMVEYGYNETTSNHFVFVKKLCDGEFVNLLLYMDDMLIIGRDTSKIDRPKTKLSKSFAIKDFGHSKQILCMKISHDTKKATLWLSKGSTWARQNQWLLHLQVIEAKFQAKSYLREKQKTKNKKMKKLSYASTVSKSMYIMVCTKLDIAHVVKVLNRFISNPSKEYWKMDSQLS
jgi:hypothetical protein